MKVTKAQQLKASKRAGRRARVRKKISGTPDRPRLSVNRSNRLIAVQLIDDLNGVTLAAASTQSDGVTFEGSGKSVNAATALGTKIAEEAKAKGISAVVFDKGWYKYHGRVKALADAARDAGLKF